MALLLLAFLGGVLTIISPCILPVVPFVFARADQPFRRSGLPLLAGMAITFAGLAAVAATAGNWIVQANHYGRIVAMVVLTTLGLTLLSSALADWLARPFVRLGGQLSKPNGGDATPNPARSFFLGIATGFLWAPCAGPILGLILTGAAVGGASVQTTLLLLAYAAGAAVSLAIALLAGGRVFNALKKSFGAEVWVRRVLGIAVLIGVAVVAFGLDRSVLTQLSLSSTSGVEQKLVDRLNPPTASPSGSEGSMMMMSASAAGKSAGPERLPDLSGAVEWLNSKPLTREELRGKVVLVDFWTYSCINCLRTMPYIRAWADRYKDSGLVVIGVHTPEFAFEKDAENVRRAVADLKITYPVPLDNDYAIWKAFNNKYWPADYLIDITGKIRHTHFGEGKYEETELRIQELLRERNGPIGFRGAVEVAGSGAEAPPDTDVQSPETYIGFERADSFLSPGGLRPNTPFTYSAPPQLELNQWAFSGTWLDEAQSARLQTSPGKIAFLFHARDLHLVLGPGQEGKPIRFRVKIDGKAPEEHHGIDTDEHGLGTVREHRLFQLIRQSGSIEDRTFEIEFLDPGVQAFAFTFG